MVCGPLPYHARVRRRAWVTWSLIVCGALALQAWVLWGERWGVATNPPSGPVSKVGEIAERIAAEQTFTMRARGLRAFTFTPRAAGPGVTGGVVFDLYDVTPEGDRSLFRIVKKGASVVRDQPYTLEFTPIDLPVPRTFKIRIALPDAKFGEGFFIDGVEHDRYAGGVLVVNDREVWGDLVFDTDASTARLIGRLDRIGRPYPPLLRSAPVVIGLVAGLNLLLAWVVWVAVATPRAPACASPLDPPPLPPMRALWGWAVANRILALGLVFGAAAVVATVVSQRERVVIDLVDAFPAAEKRTSMASLHQGFAVFDYPTVGVYEPCILALPSSRITWTVDVGPTAMLSVRVGIRNDTWWLDGDGALFRVGVATAGGYEELRRLYLNPSALVEDRRYDLLRFDLARFAGQRLNIVFNVEPGLSHNAVNDAAMWCGPRVTRR